METEPQGKGGDTGRAMVGCCRGGPEGRRQSDLDRVACGVERTKAANDGGHRSIAANRPAGIRRAGGAAGRIAFGMHNRAGRPPRQAANSVKRSFCFRYGNAESGSVGGCVLIQISPQVRILVAVEPVDGRKGIDAIAELCREKLSVDPFSGYLFIFRTRRGTAIRVLQYDGQGYWLATKRLSKGRFRWWPTGAEPSRTLRAHQAQLLLAAGNPDAEAPPAWRPLHP